MAILLTRRAVVLAAVETTFNTAATLDAATDAILVAEPDYVVDVTVLERDFTRDTLSPEAHITGRKLARMRFRGELRGNGEQDSGLVADAPIVARLLRGCGYELTGFTAEDFSALGLGASMTGLRLKPRSTDFESLTLRIYFDGTSHLLTGAFGTFTLTAEAGNYARIEFDFLGQYYDPTDLAIVTPTHETTLPAQVELAQLTIDGFSAVVAAFNFDQANDIQIRPDVNGTDGYNGTRIVGRAPSGGIDPEADLVANQNFWKKLADSERMLFKMRVGTEAGNIVWFAAPSAQYSNLTYSDRNGIRVYDAGLKFSTVLGDDEVQFFFV